MQVTIPYEYPTSTTKHTIRLATSPGGFSSTNLSAATKATTETVDWIADQDYILIDWHVGFQLLSGTITGTFLNGVLIVIGGAPTAKWSKCVPCSTSVADGGETKLVIYKGERIRVQFSLFYTTGTHFSQVDFCLQPFR